MKHALRFFVITLVSVLTAFVVVAAAFGASPSDKQYGNVIGEQLKKPPATPAVLAPAKSGGTLPFTGVDLAFVAAGAGVLLAGGATLRKLGRKNSPKS